MNGFKEVDPRAIDENFIRAIGTEWMLITAGDHVSHNTMTASWGGVGVMWGHPVATAVIRPQRYTFRFTERCDTLTLSFLGDGHRDALAYCGSHSGRDEDKIRNAGLAVEFTDGDTPAIAQARLVLECRKLYCDDLREECFADTSVVERWYPDKDFHKVYVMQIVRAYIKEPQR